MNKNSEIMCHLLIKIELPLAPLASEPRFVVIREIRGRKKHTIRGRNNQLTVLSGCER